MCVRKLSSVDLEEVDSFDFQYTEAPTTSGVHLSVDGGGFRNELLNPTIICFDTFSLFCFNR